MEPYEMDAKLFKALAHPVRLAILNVLRNGEACVCHLEAVLGQRQAYISQQLMGLREAGLVQDRREGWNIYYRVARPEVFTVLEAAQQLTGTAAPARRRPARRLERAPNCSCPRCNLQPANTVIRA